MEDRELSDAELAAVSAGKQSSLPPQWGGREVRPALRPFRPVAAVATVAKVAAPAPVSTGCAGGKCSI